MRCFDASSLACWLQSALGIRVLSWFGWLRCQIGSWDVFKIFPFWDDLCESFFSQLSTAKETARFHAKIGELASLKHKPEISLQIQECIGEVNG